MIGFWMSCVSTIEGFVDDPHEWPGIGKLRMETSVESTVF